MAKDKPSEDEQTRDDEIADLLSDDDEYEIVPKGNETATEQAKAKDPPTEPDKQDPKPKDDDRKNDPDYLRQQWQQDKKNFEKAKAKLEDQDARLADLTAKLEAAQGNAAKLEALQTQLAALQAGPQTKNEDDDDELDLDDVVDPDAHKAIRRLKKTFETDKAALAEKLDTALEKLSQRDAADEAAEAEAEAEVQLRKDFKEVMDDCDDEFGDKYRAKARAATIKAMQESGLDPEAERTAFIAAAKANVRDQYEKLKLKDDLEAALAAAGTDEDDEDLGPGRFGPARPSGASGGKCGSHEEVMAEMMNGK